MPLSEGRSERGVAGTGVLGETSSRAHEPGCQRSACPGAEAGTPRSRRAGSGYVGVGGCRAWPRCLGGRVLWLPPKGPPLAEVHEGKEGQLEEAPHPAVPARLPRLGSVALAPVTRARRFGAPHRMADTLRPWPRTRGGYRLGSRLGVCSRSSDPSGECTGHCTGHWSLRVLDAPASTGNQCSDQCN